MASPFEVGVSSVRNVVVSATGEKYTEFSVTISGLTSGDGEPLSHELKKRFRAFSQLHSGLRTVLNAQGLPRLPPKTVFKSFDDKFIEKRRDDLDRYLKDLCTRSFVWHLTPLRQFFELATAFPGFERHQAVSDETYKERVELHFENPVPFADGVRFSVYDIVMPDANTIFSAIGDDSTISRFETFLNKFKLPWEPELQKLFNGATCVWSRPRGGRPAQLDPDDQLPNKASHSALEPQVTALAWDPLTRTLFAGCSNGQLFAYKVDDELQRLTYDSELPRMHQARIKAMVVDSQARRLFVTGDDKHITVFVTTNRQFKGVSNAGSSWVNDLLVDPERKRLFCCTYGREVFVLDYSNVDQAPRELSSAREHTGSVRCLAYDPAFGVLYSAGFDNTVCVWHVEESGKLQLTDQWASPVADLKLKSVVFCPALGVVATGGDQGHLALWDARSTGGCLFVWKGHETAINKLLWQPEHDRLVSGGIDGAIHVWKLPRVGGTSAGPIQPTGSPARRRTASRSAAAAVAAAAPSSPASSSAAAPAPAAAGEALARSPAKTQVLSSEPPTRASEGSFGADSTQEKPSKDSASPDAVASAPKPKPAAAANKPKPTAASEDPFGDPFAHVSEDEDDL